MKQAINGINSFYKEKLTNSQFTMISNFISQKTGIKLPEEKRFMLQSRLYKRLKSLDIYSFKDYFDYTFSKDRTKSEIVNMIDAVSTNKTSFFREPHHFEFINDVLIPQYIERVNGGRYIRIWSAGCSSGEEPYTLSMLFQSSIQKCRGIDFSVLGTDISTHVLKKAVQAVYSQFDAEQIPYQLKRNYLLRSKDKTKAKVRITPELRQKVEFKRLNLMDNVYDIQEKFDIVFCRNVLIYFERRTQEKVLNKICHFLKPGGYLFIGHSESLFNMNVPLEQVKPTIFRRTC